MADVIFNGTDHRKPLGLAEVSLTIGEVDAEHLTEQLREVAVEQLAQAPEDELWLIADSSDLRKPYAQEMPALMQVRDLEGHLVPGYRTLNVLGVTPGRRGILYHRL